MHPNACVSGIAGHTVVYPAECMPVASGNSEVNLTGFFLVLIKPKFASKRDFIDFAGYKHMVRGKATYVCSLVLPVFSAMLIL